MKEIKSKMYCQGKTNKGAPCTKKVKDKYCCHHKNQCVVCYSNVKNEDKADIKCEHLVHIKCINQHKCDLPIVFNTTKKSTKIITTDCSICLDEVKNEDDCGLICGHGHHTECIKKIVKQECPVCRGPLKFNKNVDISEVKKREIKYKKELATMNTNQSIQLVRELSRAPIVKEERKEERKEEDIIKKSKDEYAQYEKDLIEQVIAASLHLY